MDKKRILELTKTDNYGEALFVVMQHMAQDDVTPFLDQVATALLLDQNENSVMTLWYLCAVVGVLADSTQADGHPGKSVADKYLTALLPGVKAPTMDALRQRLLSMALPS